MPGAVGGPASVYGKGVAVDEAALRGVGEEEDGLGDIVGCGEAGHGDAAGDVVVGVGSGGLVDVVHLGFDPAGADGVGADAACSPLGGEGTGESDEAVLGGVVGAAVGDAGESGDRGDVNDASLALLKHDGADGTGEGEGCDEVDLEDAVEVGGGDVFCGRDVADSGVVDEDVDLAPALVDGFDGLGDVGFVGDVAEEGFGISVGDRGAGFEVEEGEGVSGGGEEFGGATADPLRSPGDDGYFHDVCSVVKGLRNIQISRFTRHFIGATCNSHK